jgi:inner membrane protein
MDPLTQGVLGATLPQSFAKNTELRTAGLLGFIAGMSADLDVLIRSQTDPLLFLEYHRQFTHSLVFIPLGGLLCALCLYHLFAKNKGLTLARCWLYCTLGYATHALLDACTSYGTQLLWPFDSQRVAWDVISIIDPLYTLPLLCLLLITLFKKNRHTAIIALSWALIYPSIGYMQRQRVEQLAWQWAATQHHQPIRLTAKPSFANLLVWKVIYETDQDFHTFAVRAGYNLQRYSGESIAKIDLQKDFPWLKPESQQASDINRFSEFSNGYIALSPDSTVQIMDIRYSMLPNSLQALWGIQLNMNAGDQQHVGYYTQRGISDQQLQTFKKMLLNTLEN